MKYPEDNRYPKRDPIHMPPQMDPLELPYLTSEFDPDGSWTGVPEPPAGEEPVQVADDL